MPRFQANFAELLKMTTPAKEKLKFENTAQSDKACDHTIRADEELCSS